LILPIDRTNADFATVFNVSKDGIAIMDLQTNFLEFNDAYLDMTGYAREELLQKSCVQMSAPEDIPRAKTALEELLAKGFVTNFEKSCITKEGKKVATSMVLSLMPDKRRILASARDVTIQKELELQLKAINESLTQRVEEEILKRAEKEKMFVHQSRLAMMGEIIGMIAHQWRQPLNTLAIGIQDADYSYQVGELNKEYMEKFKKESMDTIMKLSKTIDGFRSFFRPSEGQSAFTLEDAVGDASALLNLALADESITIKLNPTTIHQITGYKKELEQVLLIVLTNARDALAESKVENPTITIGISDVPDGAQLSIGNNGGNIGLEIIDKIFEPYFSTKSKNTSGLGLHIAREIIERHSGGKIYAENIENGVRFIIFIPTIREERRKALNSNSTKIT
jgi:PAS domain S-box-containing protein